MFNLIKKIGGSIKDFFKNGLSPKAQANATMGFYAAKSSLIGLESTLFAFFVATINDEMVVYFIAGDLALTTFMKALSANTSKERALHAVNFILSTGFVISALTFLKGKKEEPEAFAAALSANEITIILNSIYRYRKGELSLFDKLEVSANLSKLALLTTAILMDENFPDVDPGKIFKLNKANQPLSSDMSIIVYTALGVGSLEFIMSVIRFFQARVLKNSYQAQANGQIQNAHDEQLSDGSDSEYKTNTSRKNTADLGQEHIVQTDLSQDYIVLVGSPKSQTNSVSNGGTIVQPIPVRPATFNVNDYRYESSDSGRSSESSSAPHTPVVSVSKSGSFSKTNAEISNILQGIIADAESSDEENNPVDIESLIRDSSNNINRPS